MLLIGSHAEFLCEGAELGACGKILYRRNHSEDILHVVGKDGVVHLDDLEEHSKCVGAGLKAAGVEAPVEGSEDRAAVHAAVDRILYL